MIEECSAKSSYLFLGCIKAESAFTFSTLESYTISGDTENQEAQEQMFETFEDIAVFLTILRCKNIKHVKHTPNVKQQKKRRKSGKIPFFSYYTVPIGPKKIYITENQDLVKRRSPRVHLRRGHIREYKLGKTTWVNHCVVRGKGIGLVHKDYVVQ